jgi:rare lipoprotein A (peptidoglycan hydrolase)
MDAKGRIVDLSYTGAQKLGFVSKGITKVKVQVVAKGTKI